MEKILVNTPSSHSEILVGEDWKQVAGLLPEKNVAIISDENVSNIYGMDYPSFPVFNIRPGEESKNLHTIEELAEKLLEAGIDRSGLLLAIGGGVVCDITGFLASVYMRGIRSGYISTTLLAQVDASTGGKTGVDLGGAKNIIGSFYQPEFVICDTSMLATLPEVEFLSGLAELIKTAIIGDRELFELLEHHYTDVMKRDPELLSMLVGRSVKFKAMVVSEDEKEKELRMILNFGHTFGHALEMHRSILHGFAVAEGMILATLFSLDNGLLTKNECDRIISLLRRFGFAEGDRVAPELLRKLILHDKKRAGDQINFVFASGIGTSVFRKIPVEDIMYFYNKHTG